MKTWFAIEDALEPAELTVLAQAINPNDTGEDLLWDAFFPRTAVPSIEVNNLSTVDFRPAADRREWNTRGRRIPFISPGRRKVVIIPIEANDKIEEYEIQKLAEAPGSNAAMVREQIGATIPKRVEKLVMANYRRLEVDAFSAWVLGTITQRNPEDASKTVAASFGFSGTRYVTAGTAWNDAGVNAWTLFRAWIIAAEAKVGPIQGAMMRQATLDAILADSPVGDNGFVLNRLGAGEALSEDRGRPFEILTNENTLDVFDDGGITVTRTAVFPAQRVAAIPVGSKIGITAFAPVVRAMEMAANMPGAGIDVNGAAVFYEAANGGRELNIEAQINALPIPDEQKVYVANVGV